MASWIVHYPEGDPAISYMDEVEKTFHHRDGFGRVDPTGDGPLGCLVKKDHGKRGPYHAVCATGHGLPASISVRAC